MDEKPLLDVVVVPPFETRELPVHPPKLLHCFCLARVLGIKPLYRPFLGHFSGEHLVGREGHNVRKALCFFRVKKTHHFPRPRRQHLRQSLGSARLGHHVDLAPAVLVPVKRKARRLGVHPVCNFQHQDVAVGFPKSVEQLRLQMQYVHEWLILWQNRVGLVGCRPHSISRRSIPNVHRRDHHQLPCGPNLARQGDTGAIAST